MMKKFALLVMVLCFGVAVVGCEVDIDPADEGPIEEVVD